VKPVLLDTGVIVACLDQSERFHDSCVQVIGGLTSPLITCEAVIAEGCYLLRNVNGASEAILANVAEGIFQIPMQLPQSAEPVRQILRKYRDRSIDLADACLIHLATVFSADEILTLDRDFDVYRWGRNRRFRRLMPLD
jgi:uncharacterized protein